MIGVVACEALYNVVERLAPDERIRYVTPTLHEFPLNVPDETAVSTAIQRQIDRVDGPELDRITVIYADDGESLTGIRSEHAPLLIARATDCISAFLPENERQDTDERKAAGTYYLSRGGIDCGLDSYKLYTGYTGAERRLLDEFESAESTHPDVRITWDNGEMFRRAIDAQKRVSDGQVGRFLHEITKYYRRVHLIDTGDLYGFHHEYADRFRTFLERLSSEHGDADSVDLSVIDGDDAFLRTLLSSNPNAHESESIEVFQPGSPVA